jgi:hypothetical protein
MTDSSAKHSPTWPLMINDIEQLYSAATPDVAALVIEDIKTLEALGQPVDSDDPLISAYMLVLRACERLQQHGDPYYKAMELVFDLRRRIWLQLVEARMNGIAMELAFEVSGTPRP